MCEKTKYSVLLTSSLSFFGGMASSLDIGDSFYTYNLSSTPEEADKKALAQDWIMVGRDIFGALESYEQTR